MDKMSNNGNPSGGVKNGSQVLPMEADIKISILIERWETE